MDYAVQKRGRRWPLLGWVAAVLTLGVVYLAFGEARLSWGELFGAIVAGPGGEGFVGSSLGAAEWQGFVVWHMRLPRLLLAAVGGAGLAVSGAAMQALFRNPMADPGVLGISAGASVGAVAALYLLPPTWVFLGVPVASLLTALAATFAVYVLAVRWTGVGLGGLLLSGIAVASVASALTSLLLSLSLAEWEVGRQMMHWLMGGLEERTWVHVAWMVPTVLVGMVGLCLHAPELDALSLGEGHAQSVGVDVARVRPRVLVLLSLVTASVVSVMGTVAFVGLMVPHMVRLVTGAPHGRLLPASMVGGVLLLVLADLLCRVSPDGALKLGVVTSLAGGPFFLVLLVRYGRGRL